MSVLHTPTPGPWEVLPWEGVIAGKDSGRSHHGPHVGVFSIGGAGEAVALCGPLSDERSTADARLISAALDLLESAELALELIEQIQDEEGFSPSTSIPASKLRAAISKARSPLREGSDG